MIALKQRLCVALNLMVSAILHWIARHSTPIQEKLQDKWNRIGPAVTKMGGAAIALCSKIFCILWLYTLAHQDYSITLFHQIFSMVCEWVKRGRGRGVKFSQHGGGRIRQMSFRYKQSSCPNDRSAVELFATTTPQTRDRFRPSKFVRPRGDTPAKGLGRSVKSPDNDSPSMRCRLNLTSSQHDPGSGGSSNKTRRLSPLAPRTTNVRQGNPAPTSREGSSFPQCTSSGRKGPAPKKKVEKRILPNGWKGRDRKRPFTVYWEEENDESPNGGTTNSQEVTHIIPSGPPPPRVSASLCGWDEQPKRNLSSLDDENRCNGSVSHSPNPRLGSKPMLRSTSKSSQWTPGLDGETFRPQPTNLLQRFP